MSDLDARERWDDYMGAWQEVFEKTSTQTRRGIWCPPTTAGTRGPWFPSCCATTLKNMNMTWPGLDPDVDPDEVRRLLG